MPRDLTQEQEMALAYKQKRQPLCVYCKPLDEVRKMMKIREGQMLMLAEDNGKVVLKIEL